MIRECLRIPGELFRQQRDWKGLTERIPGLSEYSDQITAIEQLLRPAFQKYIGGVSSSLIALSLNRATFCYYLSKTIAAEKILDLGSGFSTYTFKEYCDKHGGRVVSVDDSTQWLDTTKQFLSSYKLSTNDLISLDQFLSDAGFGWSQVAFDLCLLDIGDFKLRELLLPDLVNASVRNNGIIVVDDFHVGAYRRRVTEVCAKANVDIYSARKYTRRRLSHAAVIVPKQMN